MTPPKQRLYRKRTPNPAKWKNNVRKTNKLMGLPYRTTTGATARAKSVQQVDCSKCAKKCQERVSEQQRKDIFDQFYCLQPYERQKDFVCRHVSETETRTYLTTDGSPANKKRKVSRKFFLPVDGNYHPVCKTFFLKTLDVGHAYIEHALKSSEHGTFCGRDNRGRHTPANKIVDERLDLIRQHIGSFSAVESHYCRKNTNRKFLDCNLSITKMHELYRVMCRENKQEPVKEDIYRRTFNTEYNLSFHRPKKDQCGQCFSYQEQKTKETVSEETETKYKEHRQKVKEAREEKENDKEKAKQTPTLHVVTFDLEAVLPTPCSLVSQQYYKRKLGVYNLSVFSLGDKKCTCFMWNETEGKKSSCEIGTCLYVYLRSLPRSVNHVILYSDSCGGQNRNQYVSAALRHAVVNIESIQTIDQKFLVSGHTQMECDTIHQRVEKAKQRTTIYIPSQWDTVVQMAKKTDPFTVVPFRHTDVYDFKKLAATTIRNIKTDLKGNRVNWLKIRWLRYIKSEPDTIHFKYNMHDDFSAIKVNGASSRRGRSCQPGAATTELTYLYSSKLPIADAKKKDLLDLCRLKVIPEDFHSYYRSLLSCKDAPDRLLEPDMEEEEESDD